MMLLSIDEAIEVYNHPTKHSSSEHREADKIAIQSMKELKLLRAELKSHILYDKELAETKMFQLGYKKAIDDFEKSLKDYFVIPHDVRVIEMKAEQLKEGVTE